MKRYRNKETGEIVEIQSGYVGDDNKLLFFTANFKCDLNTLRQRFEPVDTITNYLGEKLNDYGNPISEFKCETCNNDFTVSPQVIPERYHLYKDCLSTNCASYDVNKDMDLLLMGKQEFNQQKVVPIVAARNRKNIRITKQSI